MTTPAPPSGFGQYGYYLVQGRRRSKMTSGADNFLTDDLGNVLTDANGQGLTAG